MRGWVRITRNRLTGGISVTGDCQAVLGLSSQELIKSEDPRRILPPLLREALEDPSVPVREDPQSGLLVTALEGSSETQIVAVRMSTEADPVYPDLPAGVVSIDHSGTLRHCNRVMGDLFDFDPGASIGSGIADVLPQPVLYSWSSVIKSVMMGHQVKVEFLPVGGRKNSGMLVRGGTGIVGLFHDITETMENEKRLRAVQKMNQAIFSASDAGILMFDVKGRILLANRAMTRIADQNSSLVGIHITDVFPGETLKWVDRSSKNLLARPGKGAISGEMNWVSGTGEQRVVQLSLQSITDDSGVVTHIMGYVDDVTEQVQGMRKLESLGRSLENLAGLTTRISSPGGRAPETGELLLEITEAEAVAVYVNDPFTGFALQGHHGSWPEGLPPEDFHEIRLPSFPGFKNAAHTYSGDRMGLLARRFRRAVVFPLGNQENPLGFILAAYTSEQDSNHREAPVGELAAALFTSGLMLRREHGEAEKLAYLLRGRDRFLEELFGKIPVPAFVFSDSGEIIMWNDEMTILSGEDGSALDPPGQQRCLDKLLSGLGGIPRVQGRFSRGEPVVQGQCPSLQGKDGQPPSIHLVRLRTMGSTADESCFFASLFPGGDASPEQAASMNLLEVLVDVYGSADPGQLLRRGAFGALKLSGADSVRLLIEPLGTASAPRENMGFDPEWQAEITHEGNRLVLQFIGGARTSHIDTLGRTLLRIAGKMSAFLTPENLEKITGIPGGLLMITDSQGRVLFANWPEIVAAGSGMVTLEGVLGSEPPPDVTAALRSRGRCTWLHPEHGLLRGGVIAGGASPRLIWFPSREIPGERTEEAEHDLLGSLTVFTAENIRRAGATLASLSGMIQGRDPLRGLANTLILDHYSTLASLEMLRLATGFTGARPARMEDSLKIVTELVRGSGSRMPDMAISEGLPQTFMDPEWVARVIKTLLDLADTPGGRMEVQSEGRWVSVDLPVCLEPRTIPPASEVLESLKGNTLDHRAVTGLTGVLLEKHGCLLEMSPEGTLRIKVPVLEQG